MPPPTTLTGYHTEVSTATSAAVTSLEKEVSDRNADVVATNDALATAVGDLAADQAANATLRIALSQARLPSDAAALVGQLQANLISTRIHQASVGAATDAVAVAVRAQQAASSQLAEAQQAQQAAATALATSQASDVSIAQWTALAEGAPATAAFAAVNAPTVATVSSDAANALEAIIGTGMLALFRQRRDDFAAVTTAREAAVTAALGALGALELPNEPLQAAADGAEVAYAADVQALEAVATRAVADISSALGVLTSGANVGTLPSEEQQALTTATPAALAQVTAEEAVLAAQAQLRTDQASLDAISLSSYESNPDFDPATDPATAAIRTTIATDETTLADAEATLAAHQGDIDNWEVLIPEAIMQLVVGFVEAERTVADYQTTNVATLLADLAAKEATYAAALDALFNYGRSSAVLGNELARRQAELAATVQVAPARENAAIRGAR